jgi:hypothetical protein
MGCARKWVLDFTAERVETEKQKLGTELHAVQQAYLTVGKAQDRSTKVGAMALAGLPYMPPPKSGHVETKATLTKGGIQYVLIMDYHGPSSLVPGAPQGMPAVIDHKTSSAPERYGLWGHDAMVQDPQTLIYAAKALEDAPDADRVFLRWLYYWSSRKSKALPSDTVITRAEVEQYWGTHVHPWAEYIIGLQVQMPGGRTNTLKNSTLINLGNGLPGNTQECDKYSGCQHAESRGGSCRLTSGEKLSACFQGLDDAKISPASNPVIRLTPTTLPTSPQQQERGKIMDLYSRLTQGLGVQNGAQGAQAVIDTKKSTDVINAPEKPSSVAAPTKGADLLAHLQAVGHNPVKNTTAVQVPTHTAPVIVPTAAAAKTLAVPALDIRAVTAKPTAPPQTQTAVTAVAQAGARTENVVASAATLINSGRDELAREMAVHLSANLALTPTQVASRAYAIADALLSVKAT